MKQIMLSLLLALPVLGFAQGVGIGTTTPAASAALEVSSTTKGLLLPRLTLAQRNALGTGSIAAPVAGLVIFQTDNTPGLYAYDGTGWVLLKPDNLGNHIATQNLNLGGNLLVSGTAASPSTTGLTVSSTGNVGIGTTTPGAPLDVNGSIWSRNTVRVDANDTNTGALSFNAALYFGTAGSETGIASKRTSGGNQYGLDFYTSSIQRMTVANSGNVGIGTTTPARTLDVNGTMRVGTSTTPGSVYSPTTGSHNLLAVAYGQLGGGAGIIYGGSDNFTLTRNSTGSYTLTFPATSGLNGYNFDNAAVMVSLYGIASSTGFINWTGGIGTINVNTYNTSGTLADRIFTFTVFQP